MDIQIVILTIIAIPAIWVGVIFYRFIGVWRMLNSEKIPLNTPLKEILPTVFTVFVKLLFSTKTSWMLMSGSFFKTLNAMSDMPPDAGERMDKIIRDVDTFVEQHLYHEITSWYSLCRNVSNELTGRSLYDYHLDLLSTIYHGKEDPLLAPYSATLKEKIVGSEFNEPLMSDLNRPELPELLKNSFFTSLARIELRAGELDLFQHDLDKDLFIGTLLNYDRMVIWIGTEFKRS